MSSTNPGEEAVINKEKRYGGSPERHGTESAVVSAPADLTDSIDAIVPLQDSSNKYGAGNDSDAKLATDSEKKVVGEGPIEDLVKQEKENILHVPDSRSTEESPLEDAMESSVATLKPGATIEPQPITSQAQDGEKHQDYLDPTPKTPLPSQPPSRTPSNAASLPHTSHKRAPDRSPTRSDAGFDEKATASEDERETGSQAEIQSIMEQFAEGLNAPGQEEIMSPRLEFAGPLLGGTIQHPPRKSSLEPLNTTSSSPVHGFQELRISKKKSHGQDSDNDSDVGPPPPPKPGSIRSFSTPSKGRDDRSSSVEAQMSPSLHRPPPPEPEPEPDLPFDFHRFLEQLRHKTADPVAKFLRSFLQEFGKKQWMSHEQVKIIGDFLIFITKKMAQCEVWREVSDAEFDNAREGMEKLVMNRLYTQTFSPAIPAPDSIADARSRRRGAERPVGPGRRGQHQEDVERDDILSQKVGIYGWIKEEHLDIPPVGDSGKRFLVLAQQGMLPPKMMALMANQSRNSENQNISCTKR